MPHSPDSNRPPPTLGQVMRRPQWIGTLALALAVATGFGLLGHWQWERATAPSETTQHHSETPIPLENAVTPNTPTRTNQTGQMMTSTGSYLARDHDIITHRINDGRSGYWVVGHFVTIDGVALAVARGWAPTEDAAITVRNRLAQLPTTSEKIVGRFLPSEAPQIPKTPDTPPHADEGDVTRVTDRIDASQTMTTMSVAALVNRWTLLQTGATYTGYIVANEIPRGLEPIDSPIPEPQLIFNWLNIFYALEWLIFAGFALFFWYRLAKDAWERELEYSHAT